MTVASERLAPVINARSIDRDRIPTLPLESLHETIVEAVADGQRVAAFFGGPVGEEAIELYAVLADDARNRLGIARAHIRGDRLRSLTPRCSQVHGFEREIAEQLGVEVEGHPWLKPVRYRRSWRAGKDAWGRGDGPIIPGTGDFYRVEGEEVHEVAVGPVHAGVIEPGHFRFQCHGERVFHLEIALGYQHRGVEEAMIGGPTPRSIHYAETVAGDTTIAHTISYCQVLESMARCQKPARAQSLRGIALELERLANHVGDLGALAGDVGFLPTASYCGRIRGDFLNMTATLCGSRFGRGMIRPGGVAFDVDQERTANLLRRLDDAERGTRVAVDLLWDTSSVMARFEGIGVLPREVARELGLVGPAARASNLARDARHDQPSGIFRFTHLPLSTHDSGDVLARAYVRWLEIQQSIEFVREQLQFLPLGPVRAPLERLAVNRFALALNEGWRGEVCHVAITDGEGRFLRYKIVDPSFHNWSGLAYALRQQEISDFPLCNKSFNLSYCGHDL